METQTIVNPAALEIPEVKAALSKWQTDDSWFAALAGIMAVGAGAVIVGTDNDQKIDGFVIITLPQALTDTLPWVLHFHNDGSRKLREALIAKGLEFIRAAGYNGFRALNQSGIPDRKWLSIFKNGGTPHKLGSTYYFDISEAFNVGRSTSNRNSGRRGPGRPRGSRNRRRAGLATRREQRGRNKQAVKPAGRSNAAVVQPTRPKRGRKPGRLHQRRTRGRNPI